MFVLERRFVCLLLSERSDVIAQPEEQRKSMTALRCEADESVGASSVNGDEIHA